MSTAPQILPGTNDYYGALKSRGRFGGEEELFESLYLDR